MPLFVDRERELASLERASVGNDPRKQIAQVAEDGWSQLAEIGQRDGRGLALGRTGRVPGTRELLVPSTPYSVAYTVDSRRDVVQVLAVIHGARLWLANF